MARVRRLLQGRRTSNVESSLAPRGRQGDLVSGGLDALAHLRMQNGGLEPQEVSVLHLVAQLRMQDGKLERLVQGSCLEAAGRQAHRRTQDRPIG